MKYKHVLPVVIAILLCNYSVFAQKLPFNKKPNVVFILADDIGYDVPTVNGGQSFSTPNIDSMVHNGLNFTHCESTPLCSPSRFMLLTGRQNYRNYSNWGYMSDTAKMVGNMMRDAGYATGFFGKLQLQMHSLANMDQWGWDKFTVFEVMDDTVVNDRRYKTPNLVDNNGRVPDNIVNGNYCDDILTSRIFDFIDENKNKPFFVYYPMSIGHAPYCPTPDDPEYAGWDPTQDASDTSFFPSMMKYMDKKIGQIIAKLKESGLANNTIVIYAGDNGTPRQIFYTANGIYHQGEKGKPWEGGTHVPMVAYWPNHIAPGGVNDDLIDFTDFFPTIAAIGKYNNLSKYGVLDGVSFYNRLLNKSGDSVRTNIFSDYNPYPGGLEQLNRWVRDRVYKLYDTTSSDYYGTYYNIQTDPEELSPLDTNHLTPLQSNIKTTYRDILDTAGFWPNYPLLTNAFASNITSNSALVTGTIVNSGDSKLIERGSTISNVITPYYRSHHLADPVTKLGTFSQTRTLLDAQTQYFYTMYAMNANASNSTGYVLDTFFTLSNPPVKQPTSLKATDKTCAVHVEWNNASFPKDGANIGGYVLIYSTNKIKLNTNANGKAPSALVSDKKSRMINIKATLPRLPAISTDISTLSKDSLYYFSLVPYTYNGRYTETYDYLTSGALTTTKKPAQDGCNANFMALENPVVKDLAATSGIAPNPSKTDFTVQLDKTLRDKLVAIDVTDASGRNIYHTESKGKSSASFGSGWKAGVYFVSVKADNILHTYKIVKEE